MNPIKSWKSLYPIAPSYLSGSPPPPFPKSKYWARIFKHLWSPGIDSKEWIPPTYVAWRAWAGIFKKSMGASRVSFETSFDSKQPKLVSALSETKRLFRLFRFYTETENFDVSIEPKQTEDQPK